MSVSANSLATDTDEHVGNLARTFASFSEHCNLESVPPAVRTRAKHLMLDAVGIALASHRFDFAHKTLAAASELASAGSPTVSGNAGCGVFGSTMRLPLRDAVMCNGVLVHGLDYDDTHVGAIVHATASALPCTLTLGAALGASGAQVLWAYLVAVETDARIGAAPRGGFHAAGFHPTGLVGTFGCALAAATLLGLPIDQRVMSQGIALSMAGGSMEFLGDGAWTKRLHPGWAGVAGVTAAYLAKSGFIGPSLPYEGRFGLFNAYADAASRSRGFEVETSNLGQSWELERVAVKPFPACHFVHGCTDAALNLAREHDLQPDDITAVEALVPAETVDTICEPVAKKLAPVSDYDAKFSLHYAVATSLNRRRFGLAELEDEARTNPATLELARKVSYRVDPRSAFPKAYSGEVVVHLRDGRVVRHREHINRGADERPLGNDEIVEKFYENARLHVAAKTADAIREHLLGLDEQRSAADVMEVVCNDR